MLPLRTGQRKERPRHDALPDADGIPKLAIDYLFSGDPTSPLTILVTHDNVTKAVFANDVPGRGTSHAYAEKALATNITLLGHEGVKIQSDQEPAIPDVKNKARQHTKTDAAPDESLEGDDDGDGTTEWASLAVQGQVCVTKDCLELKLRKDSHPARGASRCMDPDDLPEGQRAGSGLR